jgi:hypothetical protein
MLSRKPCVNDNPQIARVLTRVSGHFLIFDPMPYILFCVAKRAAEIKRINKPQQKWKLSIHVNSRRWRFDLVRLLNIMRASNLNSLGSWEPTNVGLG